MWSRLLGFSDGTSRVRGWRWPTGAPPAKRMLRITGREDTAGIEEPGDDFALSTLCAITTELPNGTNSTMIVVKTINQYISR